MSRNFQIEKAVRKAVPLFVGVWGPSGCGKTFSALRLATGIKKVNPGKIVFIGTENGRGKHYADNFDYEYVSLDPPFNSLDYLEVLKYVESMNPSVIIVDSFSHEHSGEGGYLETQSAKAIELAEKWRTTPDKATMPAWAFVAGQRAKLLQHLTRMDSNLIACFRAKEKSVPTKGKNGKSTIENMGYMPQAGKEFVFEMTLSTLLLPGSDGKAYFQTGNKGEDMMTKLPLQFKDRQVNINGKPCSLLEKTKGGIEYLKGIQGEFNSDNPGYSSIIQVIKHLESAPAPAEDEKDLFN